MNSDLLEKYLKDLGTLTTYDSGNMQTKLLRCLILKWIGTVRETPVRETPVRETSIDDVSKNVIQKHLKDLATLCDYDDGNDQTQLLRGLVHKWIGTVHSKVYKRDQPESSNDTENENSPLSPIERAKTEGFRTVLLEEPEPMFMNESLMKTLTGSDEFYTRFYRLNELPPKKRYGGTNQEFPSEDPEISGHTISELSSVSVPPPFHPDNPDFTDEM